ncbi:MAG: NAD(P)-dependent oxidoreductase [Rhodospirillales bacterium]|jgi:3-hydroxyisobutyrate dehydrogenase-like beta-hydroxyacid dehydrogenase|nr:NAD(P)-dependent oxidoreductase [Rhodospirillales bacterium]
MNNTTEKSLSGTTIGFIGLGLMGRPMARNLYNAGADMIVHSRSQGPVDELLAQCPNCTSVPNPAAVAQKADIIILMLSDTPALEIVLQGNSGVLSAIQPGTLIIDMGTSDTLITRALAKAVEDKGGAYVDAPVSGGTLGAESGELVIMAGGSEVALNQASAILDVLGKQTTHVGDIGAGQVAKAANQIIVGLTIGAVSEALALSRRAGVDPAQVRKALQGGFADSRILEVHGKRMVDHTFAPGGKCTTQRKDLDQGLALATALDMELPATALCRDLYDKLIDAGHGGLDHSALIKAIDTDWE